MSTAEQRRNLYWRDPELARKKAKDCATCNTGLGWLEKDKWLEKAKEYLRTRS